jgi:hypothetical protein
VREYTKYALQEIIGWKEFEDICTDYLYSEHSYKNIRQAGRTCDGGRDSVVLHDNTEEIVFAYSMEKDPVGGASSKFFREYNRWENSDIKEFIFMSNQDLGAKKIDLPKRLLHPPIAIYDITDLVRFLDFTPDGETIRKKYGIYSDSGSGLRLKADLVEIKNLIKSSGISSTSAYNVKISVPGTDIYYDVNLQMERSVSSIIVSNRKQDIPVKFGFNMDIDKDNNISDHGKFNIHAELEGTDIKQGLKFHKFINKAKEIGIITVKSLIVDKNIFIARFDDEKAQTIPSEIFDLLEKLSFIQEISETMIPMPNQISIQDAISIEDVYNYFTKRKIESVYQSYILKPKLAKEHANPILDLSKDGIIHDMSLINKKDSRVVCGIKILLGPTQTVYPPMKVKKPIDALRKEIMESTLDEIEIELEPVDNSPIVIYPWKQVAAS